jgi:hypothetical protein
VSAEAYRAPALAWLRSNGLTDGKPLGEQQALAASLARLVLQGIEGRLIPGPPPVPLELDDEEPQPETVRLPHSRPPVTA